MDSALHLHLSDASDKPDAVFIPAVRPGGLRCNLKNPHNRSRNHHRLQTVLRCHGSIPLYNFNPSNPYATFINLEKSASSDLHSGPRADGDAGGQRDLHRTTPAGFQH